MKPNYQVYLYHKSNQGFGFTTDKRTGVRQYHVSYETRRTDNTEPRKEKEAVDVNSLEEAKEARDRRYTELLLHGAKWKGKEANKLPSAPAPRKIMHPDQYLKRKLVKRVFWEVEFNGKYVGGSFSKVEARKIRDIHFHNREILRPCLCCGKPPVWRRSAKGAGRRGALLHDEPDCPAYSIIQDATISKMKKAEVWNRHLRNGKFHVKGRITKDQINHLL